MITNNDYEKSVLLAVFVKEVRATASERENITDLLFAPVTGGYKFSFSNSGRKVKVTAEVKGFFVKKLIIKKYVDVKKMSTYKVHAKEEISACAEQLLSG